MTFAVDWALKPNYLSIYLMHFRKTKSYCFYFQQIAVKVWGVLQTWFLNTTIHFIAWSTGLTNNYVFACHVCCWKERKGGDTSCENRLCVGHFEIRNKRRSSLSNSKYGMQTHMGQACGLKSLFLCVDISLNRAGLWRQSCDYSYYLLKTASPVNRTGLFTQSNLTQVAYNAKEFTNVQHINIVRTLGPLVLLS